MSFLYVTSPVMHSISVEVRVQNKDGGAALLSDPLAISGVFMIGASAGALVTYAKYRALLGECRRALDITKAHLFPPPDETRLRFGMEALIVGSDSEMVAIFSHLFLEKGIMTHQCSLEASAVSQLSSRKFEAIVLDFDQVSQSGEILRRLPSPNKHALVIAVASTTKSKEAASREGAAFVVGRPLVPTEIRGMLREAYGRMLRDGQSYFRLSYQLPVSIRRTSGAVIQCNSINMSQTGIAVIGPSSFAIGEEVNIAFAIPNSDIFVSAEGKVIWDDKHGKAGIKFDCTSASIQARYFEWLADHFFMARDAEPITSGAGTGSVCGVAG